MSISPIVAKLFCQFPRDVGIPTRSIVNSYRTLEKFILRNNGINDCYSSVYPNSQIVDKMFFDLDSHFGFINTRPAAARLYEYLQNNGLSPVALLSGKKGFHEYIPLKAENKLDHNTAKTLLRGASVKILQSALRKEELRYVDYSVLGDLRRLSRIPNTMRPPQNSTWCVVLPPDWTMMTDIELIKTMRMPNFNNPEWEPQFKLTELPVSDKIEYATLSAEHQKVSPESPMSYNVAIDKILTLALRPCLKQFIMSPNPPHYARYAATLDLLKHFEPEQIFEIYSHLGWIDFDSSVTTYQIFTAQQGLKLKTQSQILCETLRDHSLCVSCEREATLRVRT